MNKRIAYTKKKKNNHAKIKKMIKSFKAYWIKRKCKGCEKTKKLNEFAFNGKYYLYTCQYCQNEKDRIRMALSNAKKKKGIT